MTLIYAGISVAIAIYNGEKYLHQQLNSIYSQSYKKFEVIAVDDGSTDNTVEILQEYSCKHGLKYFVNETRLGFLKNYEKAISLCTGDYIALADQDDIWLPEKLETLINNIGDYSLICSDVSVIDEKEKLIISSLRKKLGIPIPSGKNQFFTLSFIDYVRGCTVLFKRELIKTALPIPEEAMSHDWWLGICATRMSGVKYLDQPLVLYREHSRNTLGVKRLWKIQSKIKYIFSKERKAVFNKERDRIQLYIKKKIYRNNEEKIFLEDLFEHYVNIISTTIHIKAFLIIMKYRKKLLENVGLTNKIFYILGRLF